jgi:NADPH:quinone reductase
LGTFGLDCGINYTTEDLIEKVMHFTHGKGVDLVVDPVGGTELQRSILATGHRGRISLVGAAAREPTHIDASALIGSSRSLTGVFLGAELTTDRVHNNIQRLIDEAAHSALSSTARLR